MAKKILVVDDEKGIRDLQKRVLSNHDVATAENGQRALDYLDNHTIDLLIIDCDMPELNGPSAIKALKEKGANYPIVLITTYSAEEITEKHGKVPYDYHFTKEILQNPSNYRQKIEDILKQ